jgi:hypothetical protein
MNQKPVSRRQMLRGTTAAGLVAMIPATASAAGDEESLFIEGYAGRESYAPGEDLSLHVSTSARTFSVKVFRVGEKIEEVLSQADIPGKVYDIPEDASSMGCRWPAALAIKIPTDSRSGYYRVDLQVESRGGKFTHRGRRTASASCFFVVRAAEPGKNGKILLQLATNTYNAYNNWGGTSLYAYNGRGGVQGTRVSSERPPASQFDQWEVHFVQWAERNGYQLDYAVNLDLELRPELLENYKLVLSVGHDEYWSTPMRDHLESWIGRGGNVAFFSGNTCCWQVRSENGGKALTSFKQNYFVDPVFAGGDYKTLSTLWAHHLLKRPENELTGVGFLSGGYHRSHDQLMDGSGGFKVHRPEHWIFEGTGLMKDQEFGGKDTIVGYECDGCELVWKDGIPFPTHRDGTPKTFEVLGTAPAQWHHADCEWYEKWERGRKGAACLGIYTRGGTVFTAGSTDWSHGLRGKDPIVEQITKNIVERLGK